MMFPTIVSFYTKNTGYEKEIEGLIDSCKKFNLKTSIDAIANLGSWEKNCSFKPKYILKKLTTLKCPILWLDADAIVFQKPSIFETLKADIALFVAQDLPDNHHSKISSGTLFINYTPSALHILKEWVEETDRLFQADPFLWDQVSLRNVLLRSKGEIHPLDERYYQVFDKIKDESELKKAFFIHYQASRTLKKTLNNEVVPFWDEEEFIEKKKANQFLCEEELPQQ